MCARCSGTVILTRGFSDAVAVLAGAILGGCRSCAPRPSTSPVAGRFIAWTVGGVLVALWFGDRPVIAWTVRRGSRPARPVYGMHIYCPGEPPLVWRRLCEAVARVSTRVSPTLVDRFEPALREGLEQRQDVRSGLRVQYKIHAVRVFSDPVGRATRVQAASADHGGVGKQRTAQKYSVRSPCSAGWYIERGIWSRLSRP